jgi:hypothetical protein
MSNNSDNYLTGYSHFKNINTVNEFNTSNHPGKAFYAGRDTPSAVWPIIRFQKKNYNDKTEEGVIGYLTQDDIFYPCPIAANYILIQNFNFPSLYESEYNLIIYSKDFQNKRTVCIKNRDSTGYLVNIIRYINILNTYIHEGNNLDELNLKLFSKPNPLNYLAQKEILALIDDLKIKFFLEGKKRWGKDSSEWTEAVLSNLPKSHYIQNTFLKVLKSSEIDIIDKSSVKIINSNIIITYDYSHTPFIDSIGEIKEPKITKAIKDSLKFNISSYFNKNTEICERIRIPS